VSPMETDDYLRFALSFVLVIGLIVLAGGLLRRFSGQLPSLGGGRKSPRRLKIVETLAVDPRRRLVLVRRDGVEHLLLVGGSTDLVVDTSATPAGDDSMAPTAVPSPQGSTS